MEDLRRNYYKNNSYPENYFSITCYEYKGRSRAKGTLVRDIYKLNKTPYTKFS
jgi:hypothetical protein